MTRWARRFLRQRAPNLNPFLSRLRSQTASRSGRKTRKSVQRSRTRVHRSRLADQLKSSERLSQRINIVPTRGNTIFPTSVTDRYNRYRFTPTGNKSDDNSTAVFSVLRRRSATALIHSSLLISIVLETLVFVHPCSGRILAVMWCFRYIGPNQLLLSRGNPNRDRKSRNNLWNVFFLFLSAFNNVATPVLFDTMEFGTREKLQFAELLRRKIIFYFWKFSLNDGYTPLTRFKLLYRRIHLEFLVIRTTIFRFIFLVKSNYPIIITTVIPIT